MATNEVPAYWPAERDGTIVDWSTGDFLRQIARDVPDRIAIREPGGQRQWTYAEFLAEAERVARLLLSQFEPGERVALWAANQAEWIFVQFGAALAGIVLVAINPASRITELDHALTLANVAGVFLARKYRDIDSAALLAGLRPKFPGIRAVFILDEWRDFPWPATTQALPAVGPDDVAMLQFTSGTTGKAKAAMLTHRGLVNIAQFSARRFGLRAGSIWCNWLPLFHTGGCVFALMGCMWNRGTLLLLNGFEPKSVMQIITQERPAWLPMVPTTAVAILDHPARGDYDLSSLEVITQGGTPVAPELVRRIERELGVDYVMVFGQTETSSTICLTQRHDSEHHKTMTVGKPMPHTEVRIVDPARQTIVNRGETGEIQLRSFAVMRGYFGQDDATAAAIDSQGWLRSGDLGVMEPDGYLRLTGRLKDLIIRGGENIYPREIEDLLAPHPAIAEVAVFGAPDPHWGEKLVAAIRHRPPETIDLATLQAYLAPLIARHKIPQDIMMVEIMPLTLSGKIQKFTLRDEYLKRQQSHHVPGS
jgi:fatty-acyl-CoA synthase